MAIASLDQLFAANAAGQNFKYIMCKQNNAAALAVGKWANTATWIGNPTSMIYPGGQSLAATIPGTQLIADVAPYLVGTIPTGGPVAPYTKYLVGIEINGTVATCVPSWLFLVDLLVAYPAVNTNIASAQPLGAVSLPRYATGAGVQMFIEDTIATSTTTSTLAITYVNSASQAACALAWAPQVGLVASTATTLIHSGISVNNIGPFLPLGGPTGYTIGDIGVQSVSSLTMPVTGAGLATLILCKPLVQVPLHQTLFSSGRDFVFNIPTMPIIQDGACLAFLIYTGAATASNATFHVSLDFVWG